MCVLGSLGKVRDAGNHVMSKRPPASRVLRQESLSPWVCAQCISGPMTPVPTSSPALVGIEHASSFLTTGDHPEASDSRIQLPLIALTGSQPKPVFPKPGSI